MFMLFTMEQVSFYKESNPEYFLKCEWNLLKVQEHIYFFFYKTEQET